MMRPPCPEKLEEDSKMLAFVLKRGSGNWTAIPKKAAQQLPGRTNNDVKNTRLKKKLSEMGIDHVTHKPFSELLADCGDIGGIQKPSTRTGSLGKDSKNLLKSDPYPTPPQGLGNMNSQTKKPSVLSPKMEPTESSFLYNKDYADNLSIELPQLQVPKFGEGCLSSAPSPSSSSTAAQEENLPLYRP
ncbi:hypothetical protein L6164_014637 [Bauhinia variegata]|uniref:Uncharacterized protein n=1 Tax=Bauhinia variegata TaxID=167791 RepID=A0ACB9NLN1_BAUVA|nr:hypothetical protein L6164_014637 [Bauhinia variegata]